jgi:hypothetical protein
VKRKHSATEGNLAGQKGVLEALMTIKGGNNDQCTKCRLIHECTYKAQTNICHKC